MRNSGMRSSLAWSLPSLVAAAAVAVPIIAILFALTLPAGAVWQHLEETVLTNYLVNSVLLMLLTGGFALLFGVTTAWLTGACEFKGRDTLSWLLVLPLAAPAYVVAYVYTDILEVSGPVQSALRSWLGLTPAELSLPAVRSLPGAALLLALVLYPYIYLLARNSFRGRSGVQFDAARVLGHGPYQAFFRIALPAARPAIAGGLALVLMETLADFGVVDYFSVPTLSTGIYRTWIGLGEKVAALKLAAVMLMFVFALVSFESLSRRGGIDRSDLSCATPLRLTGAKAGFAFAACFAPVLLGFIVPTGVLLSYAISDGDQLLGRSFSRYLINSASVALTAAALATIVALFLSYSQRLSASRINRSLIRLSTLGYALPGILLAIAILDPLAVLDRWLVGWWPGEAAPGRLLSGSVFALVYAYLCRFLTVAFNSIDAGLSGVSPEIDAAARTLGSTPAVVARRVHLPLLRPSLFTAALLVFVDVMRELPATLLLRPFNFDTLATRVYRLASDERISEASTAALCIVVVGVIPVLLINRIGGGRRSNRA
ncbi:MAG: iron ABC transporter permease [Pseudomonadota bacterium]